MSSVLPRPLEPGDVVSVVAPSSPFVREEFWPGLGWLRARYRLRMSSGVLARDGFLAGDDARRRVEFARAMTDDEVKAVFVARGGYGATRIVADLPWAALERRPKWIVGFSDATALHAAAWSVGVASVHGPNVTTLRASSPAARAALLGSLERPDVARAWHGLRVVRGGTGAGPAVGGNLTILQAMAAAGQLRFPRGAVVFLEDVAERPYRVDRMLTSLVAGGYFENAAAVVFGTFERCDPGPDGRPVDDVLYACTAKLAIPVVAGAPFGHGTLNDAFVLGRIARVTGAQVFFEGAGERVSAAG